MALLSIGCYIIDPQYRAIVDEEEEREKEEREAELEEAAGEEEKSFPDEPITYTGNISGLPITLTVNFKTTEVTGSMPSPVKSYPDFIVTDGKIDLDTLAITANFSGVREMDSDGNVIQTSWFTITGKISDDLSTVNGEILNDEGESGEFTATR